MLRLIGFNASGGKPPLVVDYLVVAGGGAGANGVDGTSNTGGGGAGQDWDGTPAAVAGSANTGGGGGGGAQLPSGTPDQGPGAAGGSGIVILKYPEAYNPTFSGGVTQSTSTSGGFKITSITAAGVSDTVTF